MEEVNARNTFYAGGAWDPSEGPMKIMVIGAHPDDADLHFGGTAAKLAANGARIVFVSLANGDKGHHRLSPEKLAARRADEMKAAAKAYGIEDYVCLGAHDCELEADLEMRRALTRVVRRFGPHAVFSHRGNDYHCDHRAAAQLVMDMTYLLGVPNWCPDVPIAREKPSVWFLRDAFRKPTEMSPDLVVSLCEKDVERLLDGLLCHTSQFFEWLPYDMNMDPKTVPSPESPEAREFVREHWVLPRAAYDAKRFHLACDYAEVFELSEYGRDPTSDERRFLSGSES